MIPLPINARRVRPQAPDLAYATDGASGLDLAACLDWPSPVTDEIVSIPTGWSFQIPAGYEGQIRPRSGLARQGVVAMFGTIDSDYRGEVRVLLVNWSADWFAVAHGERIAQLVIAPVVRVRLCEVEALTETRRGEGGFGSTGR